jgi:hypothetical protein
MLDLLKGMVDFSMFLEWHFLLMSLATILLFIWFIVPYFYLAELMVCNGYTEQEASKFLSVIGFTNFLGMVRSRPQTVTPSLRSRLQTVTPSLSLHRDQRMKALKGAPTTVLPSAFWLTSTSPKRLSLTKIGSYRELSSCARFPVNVPFGLKSQTSQSPFELGLNFITK